MSELLIPVTASGWLVPLSIVIVAAFIGTWLLNKQEGVIGSKLRSLTKVVTKPFLPNGSSRADITPSRLILVKNNDDETNLSEVDSSLGKYAGNRFMKLIFDLRRQLRDSEVQEILDEPIPKEILLNEENIKLGRDRTVSDVVLRNSHVSRLHATIRNRLGKVSIIDEGGASGTYVNGKLLGIEEDWLKSGDIVSFGPVDYLLEISESTKESELGETVKT